MHAILDTVGPMAWPNYNNRHENGRIKGGVWFKRMFEHPGLGSICVLEPNLLVA
jgi:hypothetical protein